MDGSGQVKGGRARVMLKWERNNEYAAVPGQIPVWLDRRERDVSTLSDRPSSPSSLATSLPTELCSSSSCAQLRMSISLAIFVFEAIIYNVVFLGKILPVLGMEVLVPPYFMIFNTFLSLTLWSFLQAHLREPGVVPQRWLNFALSAGKSLPIEVARAEWQPGLATLCMKCRVPRPERAHHCHICDKCVLRMDHHCPWINNCVGFHNYKFFLLLVIYSGVTLFFTLVTSFPAFVRCLDGLLWEQLGAMWEVRLELYVVITFCIFEILAVVVALMVGVLLYAHLPLASLNITTIEDNFTNMANPYDQGSAMANLVQVLGSFGPDWFVPVSPWRPLSDGITFARSPDDDAQSDGPDRLPCPIGSEECEVEKMWGIQYHVQPDMEKLQANSVFSIGAFADLRRWLRGDWERLESQRTEGTQVR